MCGLCLTFPCWAFSVPPLQPLSACQKLVKISPWLMETSPVFFGDVGLCTWFLYSYFMTSQELEETDVFHLLEWKLESEFLTAPDCLNMPQVGRPTFVNHNEKSPGLEIWWIWVWILTRWPPSSSHIREPQFSPLQNGNNNVYLIEFWEDLLSYGM